MTGEPPILAAKRRLVHQAGGLILEGTGLLRTPQRFTRGAYARDRRGRSVQVDDPAAVRFCLAGAVLAAEHRRHGTTVPIATSPEDDIDDLLRPVLPEAAPTRLQLALEIVAWSAKHELERLGRSYREIERGSAPADRMTTVLHYPLLLSLDRRGGHRAAYNALLSALGIVGPLFRDDEKVNRLIPDASVHGDD
jgi:hypothetical protein